MSAKDLTSILEREGFAYLVLPRLSHEKVLSLLEDKSKILFVAQYFDLIIRAVNVSGLEYRHALRYAEALEGLINLERILEGGDELVMARESARSVLCHSSNPIKTAVVIIDEIAALERKFPILRYITQGMRRDLVRVCVSFMNELGSLNQLQVLLKDKVGSSADVLYLIAEHDIPELLENPKVETII